MQRQYAYAQRVKRLADRVCNLWKSQTALLTLLKRLFSIAIEPQLRSKRGSVGLRESHYESAKEPIRTGRCVVGAAKHRENAFRNLQNQFSFCNKYLPLVRYLHIVKTPASLAFTRRCRLKRHEVLLYYGYDLVPPIMLRQEQPQLLWCPPLLSQRTSSWLCRQRLLRLLLSPQSVPEFLRAAVPAAQRAVLPVPRYQLLLCPAEVKC